MKASMPAWVIAPWSASDAGTRPLPKLGVKFLKVSSSFGSEWVSIKVLTFRLRSDTGHEHLVGEVPREGLVARHLFHMHIFVYSVLSRSTTELFRFHIL